MKKLYIWHNKRGCADQYFICSGYKVLFQIPNCLIELLKRIKILKGDSEC